MTTVSTVEIPLGDSTLDLKVDLARSKQINSAFGGFVAAYQKVTGLDLQACIAIVALGADKPAPEVEPRLQSADPAFRRQWLRLFVAEVCIGPKQIRITGTNDAICDLIERHEKMGAMVPNIDREWRARHDSNV